MGSRPASFRPRTPAEWSGAGGKVFATHYHYYWFEDGPADFKSVATWGNTSFLDPAIGAGNYLINITFSGGMTLDSWLRNVGALNGDGTITLTNVAASINTVNPPTLQWIYGPAPTGDGGIIDPTKYMSFGTPIGGITVADAGAGPSVSATRRSRRSCLRRRNDSVDEDRAPTVMFEGSRSSPRAPHPGGAP